MSAGAGILCVRCGARPYPELGPPEVRQDFDLMKLFQNQDGGYRAAGIDEGGEWYCSKHFKQKERARFVVIGDDRAA
jgi:hypothetical protein